MMNFSLIGFVFFALIVVSKIECNPVLSLKRSRDDGGNAVDTSPIFQNVPPYVPPLQQITTSVNTDDITQSITAAMNSITSTITSSPVSTTTTALQENISETSTNQTMSLNDTSIIDISNSTIASITLNANPIDSTTSLDTSDDLVHFITLEPQDSNNGTQETQNVTSDTEGNTENTMSFVSDQP